MSEGPEGRRFDDQRVRYPFLLECDSQGRVLWLDENTRHALGDVQTLIDAIPNQLYAGAAHLRVGELSLTRIWEGGGRILLGAREVKLPPENEVLLRLEGNLLRNYMRLQAAERVLSMRARERRPTARSPIQQIEAERQRLGRELHTSVGQLLSAIRLQLEIVAAQVLERTPNLQQALDRISTLSADALERVRSIAQRLHPPEWQRFPIEEAIRQMWDLSGIPQAFDARLTIGPLPIPPDLDTRVLLYRASQEAVSNIVRHSRATRVEAALTVREGFFVLRFVDNGTGFDPPALFAAPPNLAGGIGLRTIREQAEALGGTLVVESGSEGTTLELTVPAQSPQP